MALSEAVGTGQKIIKYSHVDVETATRYSAEYAYLSWKLAKVLRPKLEEAGLTKLYYEMELPLISVLAEMEINGIYIDMAYLHEMGRN